MGLRYVLSEETRRQGVWCVDADSLLVTASNGWWCSGVKALDTRKMWTIHKRECVTRVLGEIFTHTHSTTHTGLGDNTEFYDVASIYHLLIGSEHIVALKIVLKCLTLVLCP